MADEVLRFDFQVAGIRDVQQAFGSIEQSFLRIERAARSAQSSFVRDARERGKTLQGEAKERERLASQAGDRAASAESKVTKALFDEARARIKIRQEEQRNTDRELARSTREYERAEKEKTRIAAREAREREKEASAAARNRRDFGRTVGGAVTRGISGTVGTIASLGGTALTLGGSFAVGTAIQRGLSAESASVSLANSMYNPSDAEQQAWLAKNGTRGRFDDKAILSLAGRVQAASGIDKGELAKGWQDYIAKSSDWKSLTTPEGQQRMIAMAQLSKATGSDFGQVMGAAGALRVQNKNLTDDQMMKLMYGIVGQGKMGAVEMKDLAEHASVITSGSGSFAMDQGKAQQALLGLSQIAIRTSGSPAEAATAVARFSSDVQHHAKDMGLFGIDAIADKKTGALKSPSEILAQIFEKTGGNTARFGEGKGNIGLGRESVRIANALAPTYRDAVDAARSGGVTDEKKLAHIGAEAVRAEVLKFENAGYRKEDIDEDLKRVQATTQERFNRVTLELTDRLESRFLPIVEKLAVALEKNAPEFDRFIDAIGRTISYLVENPYRGVGALIAVNIGKELAAAGIQKAAEAALATSLGKAGIVAGTAVVAAQLGMVTIDQIFEKHGRETSNEIGSAAAAFAEAKGLERDAIEGKLTPEKKKRLEELHAQMTEQVKKDEEGLGVKSTAERLGWFLGGDSGLAKILGADGEESARYQKERDDKLKQSTETLTELNKALDMAAKAAKNFSSANDAASPDHPDRKGPLTSPERK